MAFVDCDLTSSVEGTVNAILKVCRKISVLYDLGSEMGDVAFLMDRGECILLIIEKSLWLENSCICSIWKDAIDLLLDYLFLQIFDFDLEGQEFQLPLSPVNAKDKGEKRLELNVWDDEK